RATPTRMLTIRRMASLPLSLPIPGYRGSRCEIEVQDPGGGLTLDPLARDRVAEEGDFEGGVDLGLARLPVEPAVERQKLVGGRGGAGTAEAGRIGKLLNVAAPPDGTRTPQPNVWSGGTREPPSVRL